MRIVVIGAGGVGGYFGGRLAEAGQDVVFVARGRHRDAIEADGLRIRSQRGDLHLKPARVVTDPAEAGAADFVLICSKLWGLEEAARAARPIVGPNTGVMALQNGIDKERITAEILGEAPVMGSIAAIAAIIAEPGVIAHTGTLATFTYGELDRSSTARLDAFDEIAQAAPAFEAVRSDDVRLDIWKKFSFLAPFAGVTCYYREPIGTIRDTADKRATLDALVRETVEVGRAAGVAFGPKRREEIFDFVAGLPAEMKSSMLHDLETGNRLELDWLTGAVVRLGRELGIETPVSAKVCRAIEDAVARA